MPDLTRRLGGLSFDRAPLRRAGVLGVLLVALLLAGKAFGPSRAAADAPPARQEVLAMAEAPSASPLATPAPAASRPAAPRPSSMWTVGRVAALVLLAGGVGGALLLRRRQRDPVRTAARLEVIESRPMGTGHSLQLVACGDEVLLLSVAADGARMLRHWPRAAVDREPPSFAAALADASHLPDTDAPTDDAPLAPHADTGTVPSAPPLDPPEADIPDVPLDAPEADAPGAPGATPFQAPAAQHAPALNVAPPRALPTPPASTATPTPVPHHVAARGALFPAPAAGLPQFGFAEATADA